MSGEQEIDSGDSFLTSEERANGFMLWEDDHCVYILQCGHQVAVFSKSMTKESLRAFLNLIIQTQQEGHKESELL
ncbi:hypothetical protein ES703_107439 [subsurface metagenome]